MKNLLGSIINTTTNRSITLLYDLNIKSNLVIYAIFRMQGQGSVTTQGSASAASVKIKPRHKILPSKQAPIEVSFSVTFVMVLVIYAGDDGLVVSLVFRRSI
jgi:hypothetical protein